MNLKNWLAKEIQRQQVEIRTYRGDDFQGVVDVLHALLFADAVTPELFAKRVLLDPNFDPAGAIVALDAEETVVGFLVALARKKPLEDGPDDREKGWITLFAVEDVYRRRGIGTAMLKRGLEFLRKQRCRSVLVSPYAPNYWTPGVDVAAYPGAVAFLEKHGFTTISRPLSMDVSLTGNREFPEWVVDKIDKLVRANVSFTVFRPEAIPALNALLRAEFPGDWQRYLRETMLDIMAGRRSEDSILLAWEEGELLGFAQHEGERFGPFGVAAKERGRGIGAALLFQMLDVMRRKGHHNAWFLWTDDTSAKRVYAGAGFRETRRYAVMKRDLR